MSVLAEKEIRKMYQFILGDKRFMIVGIRISLIGTCAFLGHVVVRMILQSAMYKYRSLKFRHIRWFWDDYPLLENLPFLYKILPWTMQISVQGGLRLYFDRLKDVKSGAIWPVVFSGASFVFDPQVSIADSAYFGKILNDVQGFPKYNGFYNLYEPILGRGLLTASGDAHKRQRKAMTPAFHFNALQSAMRVMHDNATHFLEAEIPENDFLIGQDTFKKFTLSVITNYTFSSSFDTKWMQNAWSKILNFFVLQNTLRVFVGDFVRYIPNPSSAYLFVVRRKIYSFISRREALLLKHGFLVRNRHEELDGRPQLVAEGGHAKERPREMEDLGLTLADQMIMAGYSRGLIVDECTTFLFAGHDTTSSLLSWTAYELSLAPQCQERIRRELESVFGPGPVDHVTPQDLKKLEYLNAVLKEVLRLWPPVTHVPRLNQRDDLVIDGASIPRGAVLELVFFTAHRDPKTFPDPDTFRPDRWLLPPDSEEVRMRHPYAYLPFLAGPRNCIGQKFGLQEATAIIARLLSRYELVPASPGAAEAVVPVVVAVVEPRNLAVRCRPLTAWQGRRVL